MTPDLLELSCLEFFTPPPSQSPKPASSAASSWPCGVALRHMVMPSHERDFCCPIHCCDEDEEEKRSDLSCQPRQRSTGKQGDHEEKKYIRKKKRNHHAETGILRPRVGDKEGKDGALGKSQNNAKRSRSHWAARDGVWFGNSVLQLRGLQRAGRG